MVADSALERFGQELPEIYKQGFTNVGLRVSMGDLIPEYNVTTNTATYNESYCDKLGEAGRMVELLGMQLIFNVHLKEHVPLGLPDTHLRKASTDECGVEQAAVLAGPADLMVHPVYKKPIIEFHRKFASCFRDTPKAVLYWKHAFESCYLFPSNTTGPVPHAIAAFQQWARDTNPAISHWADRWGEKLGSFSDITLPLHHDSKPKLGDYYRFWLLGVLKAGTYGTSIGDIAAALREGAGASYDAQLGFKHWKPINFETITDMTTAELKQAYNLPINVTALGKCPRRYSRVHLHRYLRSRPE